MPNKIVRDGNEKVTLVVHVSSALRRQTITRTAQETHCGVSVPV